MATGPLPPALRQQPPLDGQEVLAVYGLLCKAEEFFGSPQDIEWTIWDSELWLLQSRPLTTAANEEKDDKRPWYLSLKRSRMDRTRLKKLLHRAEDFLSGLG